MMPMTPESDWAYSQLRAELNSQQASEQRVGYNNQMVAQALCLRISDEDVERIAEAVVRKLRGDGECGP